MQLGGIRLAKIFGIEIWLDYSWLIIFFLIFVTFTFGLLPAMFPELSLPVSILTGLFTTVLFFVSVIAHELGHSIYARSQGLEIRRITLFVFGGASELIEEPKTPRQEFIMAAVGPLTSLGAGVIFGILWWVGRDIGFAPLAAIGGILAVINVSLAIFNLLPGFPLDGGRILRSIIWQKTGSLERATRRAAVGGRILGIGLIVLGVIEILFSRLAGGLWLILIGLFLYQAANLSYARTMSQIALRDLSVRDLMTRSFTSVPRNMLIKDLLEKYILRQKDPVVAVRPDKEHPAGMLDIRLVPEWGLRNNIASFLPEKTRTLTPGDSAIKALDTMMRTGAEKLPVIDRGKLVGVLTAGQIQTYIDGKSKLGG